MMLVVTVNAIFFHAMPRVSRPDILFAVTVPEAFAVGAGRTLVSRYRAIVWSGAAAALAISLRLPAPQPGSIGGAWLMMGVVAGNMIVALAAWLLAHRKARAYAIPPADVRAASLVPRDTSLPGGALLAVGPFAILLATALLVYAYRGEVRDGAHRTESFGFLGLGAVYVAMSLAMAVSMARRTRQVALDGPAAVAEQRYRRVNVLVPVLIGYGVAIQLSAATVASIPAFGDPLSGSVGFVLLPLMLFNFGVTFWMFRVGQGGQRPVAPAARQEVRGDATPDHAWKLGGLFYFNPRDPAVWVENRVGVGYTLNMGNFRAWLLIIGMVLVPMVASRLLF
jgi:uncharacterized membrane protein